MIITTNRHLGHRHSVFSDEGIQGNNEAADTIPRHPHQQRGNFFLNGGLKKDTLQKPETGISDQMFGKTNFVELGLKKTMGSQKTDG